MLSERMQQRMSVLEADSDVAELFGTRPGAQAVVIGGGPSLDEQLEKIRADRDQLLVIAVTRALGAVVAVGRGGAGTCGAAVVYACAVDAPDRTNRHARVRIIGAV